MPLTAKTPHGRLGVMFEWHGRATIRASAGVDDDEGSDTSQRRVEADVIAMVSSARKVHNELIDVRGANGDLQLWMAGNHNHRSEAVIDFYTEVARVAPGSYGILHAMDHNVATKSWERWVMIRGHVSRQIETSLTPYLGLVEDVE